ncbi:hypothetical protein ACLOJK_033382 [Asimina triloba]
MASKISAALFLSLNLVLFAFASATRNHPCVYCNPTPIPLIPTPPPPPPKTPSPGTCPIDALKLGVCANLLGLVNVVVGSPPTLPCCYLIQGLLDLEAAICLCTAIKADILGIINLNISIALSLVLNNCGRSVPYGFQCP